MGTFRPDTGEGAIIGKGATPLSDKRKYCNYRAIVYWKAPKFESEKFRAYYTEDEI